MLFNSIDFAIFLPITFFIYWFMLQRNLQFQNLFVVLASYVFYGWLNWWYLLIIFFSTSADFLLGLFLKRQSNEKVRRLLLLASIVLNLGLLAFFKYYNFFVDNFVQAFTFFGSEIPIKPLTIILPAGISFYTFQALSYTIDVYRRKLEPTTDFITFAAFVSFFPQLVAGPIEKAKHLLPQFKIKRVFDYSQAVNGMQQILWGLFKKVVIADNCASYANLIYNNYNNYSGPTLVLGAILFVIQIYCDFSAYCDIAIGTARLFGFELMQNFAFPFFSRNVVEFWRRWHISLHNWFTDYLYIPLGGNKGGKLKKIRNVFLVFLIAGFWHGASWSFIAWGVLTAIYFLPSLLINNYPRYDDTVASGKALPTFNEFTQMLCTFMLFAFSMILFRLDTLADAKQFILSMFQGLLQKQNYMEAYNMIRDMGLALIAIIVLFFAVEWMGREGLYALEALMKRRQKPLRIAIYYTLVLLILIFGRFNDIPFIYFQF